MKKSAILSAIFQIHLWLGLMVGVYAFLIGVTGSVLMFREEIVDAIAPAPIVSGAQPASLEQIYGAIQARYPESDAWSLEIPPEPGQPWSSYLLGKQAGTVVFADGAARVVGERNLAGTWFAVFERFHSNLLLPGGRLYNGIGGLVLTIVALTGLLLWWPVPGGWASAFRLVRTSNWKGVVYDLHRVGGAVSLLFVVMFSITGAYFTWPPVYRKVIAAVLPVAEKKPVPKLVNTGPRKSLDALLAVAQPAIPDGRPLRLLVPKSPGAPVRAMFRHGEAGQQSRTSTVLLNGHTGEVVAIEAYADNRVGDVALGYFPVLHTGNFGGIGVRLVWAIAGLALPFLFITGFLMWCNRFLAPRLRGHPVRHREEPMLRTR